MEQINNIRDRLQHHANLAAQEPLAYFVIIVGDFNFRFADKPIISVPDFECQYKEPKLSKHAKKLKLALDRFTRVEHDQYSHFNTSRSHLNDIDFTFVSAPGWSQLPWHVWVEVDFPEELFARRISDHGAVVCRLHFSGSNDVGPPIRRVAKLPGFKTNLDKLIKASRFVDLLPEHALEYYKILIREAARVARNNHNNRHRDSPPNETRQPCVDF